MRFLAVLLLLSGCAYFKPKGINIGIELVGKPTLIKGEPVDKSKWPHIIRIQSPSGSCTASIVGPQAILTAAHCTESGQKVSFSVVGGQKYTAVMQRYENYSESDDLDLALGKVDRIISGVKPVSVRTDRFEKKGLVVDMFGYGCTQPGGGGGNDGVLRKGHCKISAGQNYDLVCEADPSALCFGDSGGPAFVEGKQIAVNSKGNIEDKSYLTRLTLPASAEWLKKTASALGVLVCGVSTSCTAEESPGPKTFKFENELLKLEGVLK